VELGTFLRLEIDLLRLGLHITQRRLVLLLEAWPEQAVPQTTDEAAHLILHLDDYVLDDGDNRLFQLLQGLECAWLARGLLHLLLRHDFSRLCSLAPH